MNINVEELMNVNDEYEKDKKYDNGYRIVYFYDDHYFVGEYCKTIEGFMIGFAENNPIMDESDIPKFVSIDDLLDRYLNDVKDATAVALYKIDGTLVLKKERPYTIANQI